jgi:Ca2+-binding EF-hand superfamily protein|tara:strand:- start:96 stop:209 length:114 start_codon:yes stop_codon:yes gene_type:complete
MRTAFDMFDKDGSGKIDKSELLGILSSEDTEGHVPKN